MASVDKLIKVGVKYSDKYFEDLKELYIRAYSNCMSFEEFLNETSDYSIGNPLDAGGFNETLTNLVASSINDIRFSRPAQKALMNNIIKQTTGELITNVGEDIKGGVRDIVKRGYNTGTLSHKNVADEITSTLDGINKKRARTIARTEIKRAQTTSAYMVAKERGANAYRYKCGAKPCKICKPDKGEVFPIDDLEHLPPRHPNCMCGVTFFKDPNIESPNTTMEDKQIETLLEKVNPKNSYSNIKLTKEDLKPVIAHQKRTKNASIEYGNFVELDTKKLFFPEDVKGTRTHTQFSTLPNTSFATLHNHPWDVGFSGGDIREILRLPSQKVCYATTENNVWVVKETAKANKLKTKIGIPEVIYKETCNKLEDKWQSIITELYNKKYQQLIDNASSKKEIDQLIVRLYNETDNQYDNWLLKEYGSGISEDNLFEIICMPIKEFKNVQF